MTEELKKIKELVEIIVSKIRSIDTNQSISSDQIRMIRDQQSVINGKLDNIEERLDTHTSSLVKIEATLEGYGDMYKLNKEKSEGLEERMDVIEDQLGIPKNN